MKLYTCAFAFSRDGNHVLLIEKDKPEWQKGLLNGIGGKVEQGESIVDATLREFQEETGMSKDIIKDIKPKIFHSMLWPEYESHTGWPLVYFSAFTLSYWEMECAGINTAGAMESCKILSLSEVRNRTGPAMMPNLPFLIEMGKCMTDCPTAVRFLRQPIVPTPGDWQSIITAGHAIPPQNLWGA